MSPRRKILIADDAPMFRELGSVFLARTGRVLTANNGYEALDVARRHHPDVVVADMEMPCMSGEELCLRIKADAELSETPVILVTSSDAGEERARAVRAGADDVIAKPISRMTLIQAVNRFLRGTGPRGLARVELETRVHIIHESRAVWGTARNLSRGGIFVEADFEAEPETEVSLEFALPDGNDAVAPTAQVVWHRAPSHDCASGVGLQFLALDRDAAQRIEAFVYERSPALAAAR